jgi:hypothetical protein
LLEKIRAQRAALAAISAARPATSETIRTARELLGVDEALAFQSGSDAAISSGTRRPR